MPEARSAPRVVLADDDVLLREGLASLLNHSGFEVVGQAGNGTELLALVRSVHPELAIIDIRMPPTHATEGLRAARVIRHELPGTAIIVLSAHVEVDEAMELLTRGGRVGYLLKTRVLALMAEGASNAGIARRIVVTEGTVEKHVRSILTKLNLAESDAEHRRVLAVLRFLDAR
jgi:DNA-binding NarL/FixJ family response regulator